MVKKRSVFDIDFDPGADEDEPAPVVVPSPVPAPASRRGPMASAISEAAEATHERARTEAAIREENDRLAHEHVRLKKLGLITDLIAVEAVRTGKLTRDRRPGRDAELDELKESIREVGLSNPIRVEQTDAGYELIQGYRRLTAFRELLEETGDTRYSRIPAAMVPRGEPLVDLYRKMVDENLVRKDISFGEMAQLAINFARDEGVSAHDAVGQLYASALKQKRSYIRSFARVLDLLDGAVRYPEAIPRALGLDLFKVLDQDPALAGALKAQLDEVPERTADAELAILRRAASAPAARPAAQAQKASARTSLRLARHEGEARVTAANGKLELRLNRDFSDVPRDRLQQAIEAFFDALDT